jgi:hypothetical protein
MMKNILTEFFHDKTGDLSIEKFLIALAIFIAVLVIFYYVLKRFGHINIIGRIKKVIKNIIHGLSSIRNLRQKRWFIFHSFLIWTMYWFASTAGLYALRETQYLGFAGGLTTLVIGTLGIILTPNGIGAYPLLIAQLLGLYGLNPDTTGNASGWLMWSAQTAVILIGGLICFVLISRINKNKMKEPVNLNGISNESLSKN